MRRGILGAIARPVAGLAVAFLTVAFAAGCGSDNTSGPSLAGAGSTFVNTILLQWVKDYKSAAKDVTINYQAVGSGTGIQQLGSKTVDFAGTDVPLGASDAGGPSANYEVPWTAGGIAIEYNLPGVSGLRLSGDTLAGLFAGKITKWNDDAVKADNPTITDLPDTKVQVVHRSDSSGTTAVFTGYLAAISPSVWTYGSGKDVGWPAGTGAKGSDGVTAAVSQSTAAGSIGYAELSFAKQSSVGVAMIKNAAGTFVDPANAAGVTDALAEGTLNPDLTVTLNYKAAAADAYPISTVTYVVFPKSGAASGKTDAIKAFVRWALGDGQKSAQALGYAPLPQQVLTAATSAVK